MFKPSDLGLSTGRFSVIKFRLNKITMSKKNQFLSIPEELSEIKEFHHSLFWIEDNVIFGKYKPDLVINLEVAKEAVNDRKKCQMASANLFLLILQSYYPLIPRQENIWQVLKPVSF